MKIVFGATLILFVYTQNEYNNGNKIIFFYVTQHTVKTVQNKIVSQIETLLVSNNKISYYSNKTKNCHKQNFFRSLAFSYQMDFHCRYIQYILYIFISKPVSFVYVKQQYVMYQYLSFYRVQTLLRYETTPNVRLDTNKTNKYTNNQRKYKKLNK